MLVPTILLILLGIYLVVNATRRKRRVAPSSALMPTRLFGVQIHPFISVADLNLLTQVQPHFCRCDMGMDVPLAQTDLIYGFLMGRDITPIFITSRVSDLSPEAQSAYITFHAELAARYPAAWWEICNETNTSYFWASSKPDAMAYAQFARKLIPRLRVGMHSKSAIISGGTSGIPLEFMRQYLQDGGLSALVDYVGFHPYGWDGSQTFKLASTLATLRSYTDKPLFATEYGLSGANNAQSLTDMATACGNQGIPFIWYQLKDGAPNTIDPSNKFGLFTDQNVPKPSLAAARAYIWS